MVGYGWGKGRQATYVAKGPGVPRIGRQEAEDDDEVPVFGAMAVGPYECVYGWCVVSCERWCVCDVAKKLRVRAHPTQPFVLLDSTHFATMSTRQSTP